MGVMTKRARKRGTRRRAQFLVGVGSMMDLSGQATYASAKAMYPTQSTGTGYSLLRMHDTMSRVSMPSFKPN